MNDGISLRVPFDDGNAGMYEIEVVADPTPDGDVVRLYATPEACQAFSEIFRKLASSPGIGHVHLGTNESEMGPGFSVFLNDLGRRA